MIRKDWRKRLRLLKNEKELFLVTAGLILIPSSIGGFFAGIGGFLDLLVFTGATVGTATLIMCINEVFFTSEPMRKILGKSDKKQIEKEKHENILDDKYPHKMWEKNKGNMRNVAKDTFLYYDIVNLNIAISYILKNAPLSLKEKKYFAQEFPSEMIEILNMYQELQGEHRKRMKNLIQKGIEQKKKEWEQVYIEPMQNKLEEICEKKVEQTFQRQQEHIYLTD